MTAQVFDVLVSPAQRWIMFELALANEAKLPGKDGPAFRRFFNAFGLKGIRRAMQDHGAVLTKRANDETPALFEGITLENLQFLLRFRDSELHPARELIIGDLFDAAQAAIDARYVPPDTAGVPVYDPAADEWAPPKQEQDVARALKDVGKQLQNAPLELIDAVNTFIQDWRRARNIEVVETAGGPPS